MRTWTPTVSTRLSLGLCVCVLETLANARVLSIVWPLQLKIFDDSILLNSLFPPLFSFELCQLAATPCTGCGSCEGLLLLPLLVSGRAAASSSTCSILQPGAQSAPAGGFQDGGTGAKLTHSPANLSYHYVFCKVSLQKISPPQKFLFRDFIRSCKSECRSCH